MVKISVALDHQINYQALSLGFISNCICFTDDDFALVVSKIRISWFNKNVLPQLFSIVVFRALPRVLSFRRFRCTTLKRKIVIEQVIQRNSYFGHPENILLTMLWFDRKNIRKPALRLIKTIRMRMPLPEDVELLYCSNSTLFNMKNIIIKYQEL